jgi:hypothetical protein
MVEGGEGAVLLEHSSRSVASLAQFVIGAAEALNGVPMVSVFSPVRGLHVCNPRWDARARG